jgi:hypothetical protein
MPKIGPMRTGEELHKSAQATYDGKGNAGLPGVKTDACHVDANAYNANGELAERIKAAIKELKGSDRGVPRFVLGWRLYPNAASAYWKSEQAAHSCGCGCGCSSHKKKRKNKKKGG